MRVSTAFPSKYLKAADLGESEPIVKIKSVEWEDVGGGDQRPVAYFEGKGKGLVLNKTNANTIATIADDDEMDNWHGIYVRLYIVDTNDPQGKPVKGIRVRRAPEQRQNKPDPQAPLPQSESPADDFDDDIPF